MTKALEWKGEKIKHVDKIIKIALAITDDNERVQFVKAVSEMGEHAISNIGYCAGYYDNETAKKILTFFDTKHPIFGKDWPDKPIEPHEAFELGRQMAQRLV